MRRVVVAVVALLTVALFASALWFDSQTRGGAWRWWDTFTRGIVPEKRLPDGSPSCSREDSNLHGLPHTVLSRTRLPIPPREQTTAAPPTMRMRQRAARLNQDVDLLLGTKRPIVG